MKKNKFQLKREATYQLLLEAGMKCFSENGYAVTTISDIVELTGHTKGAFYGHFKSKEEFFIHILDYQFQITDGWTDVPKGYSPADTTLEEVLAITMRRLTEKLHGVDNWIIVLVDFYLQTKDNPAYQEQLRKKYREWVEGIETLIRVLQEGGWVSREKDASLISKQVIAFNEGYTIFARLFGGSYPQALTQGLVKLMA